MTPVAISTAIKKIDACKAAGYTIEALIRNYQLNIRLLKLILQKANPDYNFDKKRLKTIVKEFVEEINHNPQLKGLITKKTFKLVRTWLQKTDVYFKLLKLGELQTTKTLLAESSKITGVLNISVNKLFSRTRA